MNNKKKILLLLGIVLITLSFLINVFSIFRLLILCIGIILIDISLVINKKRNIFLITYLPIILLIFTYSLDYLKTYTLNLKPIYVFENKINDKVSVYNSLFYRVFKCNNEYIFDNNYEKNFACETSLLENIDINKLLNEPKESFKTYKNDFIKVTGKISRIIGNSSIELQSYTITGNNINGYVKFNETSKLIVKLKDIDTNEYKIYDYITVVGLLESFDAYSNKLTLIDTKLEENNLYKDFNIEVIEKNNCDNTLSEYFDNYYTLCLENIYLDYNVDKYELSYALKDGKITFDKLLENASKEEFENKTIYKLEKINVLSCSLNKNVLLSKNEKIDYSLCEE